MLGWASDARAESAFFMSKGWRHLLKRSSVDILEYLYWRGLGNELNTRRDQEMNFSWRCFLKSKHYVYLK